MFSIRFILKVVEFNDYFNSRFYWFCCLLNFLQSRPMLDFSNSHLCDCVERKKKKKKMCHRQNNNSTIFAFDFFFSVYVLVNNYDIRWMKTVGLDQECAKTQTRQWLKNRFQTFVDSFILQHQLFGFNSCFLPPDTLEKC